MLLYYFLEYLIYGGSYTTFMTFYYTFNCVSSGYSFLKWLYLFNKKKKKRQDVILLSQRIEDDVVIVDYD